MCSSDWPEALHEAHEADLERLGIELTEYPAEGVMAGDAMLQAQKLTQKKPFGSAKDRLVRTILAAAQHA